MTLMYLVACFVTGVYAGSLLTWPPESPLLAAVLPAAISFLWRRSSGIRFFSLCVLALLLGAARYRWSMPQPGPGDVGYYISQNRLRLVGVVVEPPDVRDTRTYLRVAVSELLDAAGNPVPAHGLVQLTVPRYPQHSYGERLEAAGRLEEAPVFEDFSYKDYLARQGVQAVMVYPAIRSIDSDQGNVVLALLYSLRARAQQAMVAVLPEPQAGLTMGVVLGTKTALPEDFSSALQRVGLTHIVVVSGFNLTIVAGLLQRLTARRLGPYGSFAAAVGGIVVFTLMVGASPAVVRAAIMVTVSLLALALGRQNAGLNALSLAAGLMVAWWPLQLWDVGFQLSVAATAGLIWLAPVLEGWLGRVPEGLRADLAVALAAQAMTMPIIAANFHQVSFISPLANLAVLWAVPWLMLFGALAAGVAMILPAAGSVLGWAAWAFATYIVNVVQRLAAVPGASAAVPSVPLTGWVAYFVALALAVGGLSPLIALLRQAPGVAQRVSGQSRRLVGGLILILALVWAAVLTAPDQRFHVYFLDVGEGDATLIRTAQGQTILVDGGPSPSAILNALGHRLPFWTRDIDLVVLSHPNEDHMLGLVEVLRRYRVHEMLESGSAASNFSYVELMRVADENGVVRVPAQAGQRVDLGDGARLEVLHPQGGVAALSAQRVNEGSVVLRLVVGDVALLLTGDLDEAAERELLSSGQVLTSSILKVPHHGARSALDPAFLQGVAPRAAVLSVGADNRFGHPAPETLATLEGVPLYRTDQQGTIEVLTDGKDWRVNTER